jgi:hypothetical protein
MIDPRVVIPKPNRSENFVIGAFNVATLAIAGLLSLLALTVI